MERLSLRPIAPGWTVGAILLLGAVAGPAMATGSISGKVTVPATRSADPLDSSGSEVSGSAARVNATNDKFQDFRTTVGADGTYKLDGLDPGREPAIGIGYRNPNGLGAEIEANERAALRPVRCGIDEGEDRRGHDGARSNAALSESHGGCVNETARPHAAVTHDADGGAPASERSADHRSPAAQALAWRAALAVRARVAVPQP